jgi:hypothetical protein
MSRLDIFTIVVAIAAITAVILIALWKKKRESFQTGEGVIIYGNDIEGNPVKGVASREACEQACKGNKKCAYYTWLGPNSSIPNTCWLKTEKGGGRNENWTDSFTGSVKTTDVKKPEAISNPVLEYHNMVRERHGAAPLVWDDGLAAEARAHVDTCQYGHGGAAVGHGQNIALTWRDDLQGPELWYAEVDAVRAVKDLPELYFQAGGHFTQMVWKGTTHLGCASKQCGDRINQACHYRPGGNMLGEYGNNVSP